MTEQSQYPLLSRIDSPHDLRQLPESSLEQLAREVRAYLLESVSQSGGHFAAGLGTVELTVALHYLYNTPEDRIVWDVGHQAYPHKMLTGRRDRMRTIRKYQGLAPFPKREESPYDTFGVGHSSTSISAALGMAIAARQTGSQRRAVAVIGDGGLTAGLAFEALNHAGDIGADLLVILNDNNMSISPNVGALSNRFAQLLSGKLYTTVREGSKKVLSQMPNVWELARRAEEHVKGLVMPGTLFEEFGFNYIGPIDGHHLPTLLSTLRNLRDLSGPQFLHIITRKGKGYAPAEEDPVKYHGVSPFDPTVGIVPSTKPAKQTYSDIFGDWLCDMAKLDKRLIGITPAMREGSGLVRFAREHRVTHLIHRGQITAGREHVGELAPACLRMQLTSLPRPQVDERTRKRSLQTVRQHTEQLRHASDLGQLAETRVTTDEFVSTGAREGHLDAGFPDGTTDEVGIQCVERWLVDAAYRCLELTCEALLGQHQFAVIGSEARRDVARIRGFIESGLVETDVERHDRGAGPSASHGSDDRRIDATAEEHAERHVADEVHANGLLKLRFEALDALAGVHGRFSARQAPVRFGTEHTSLGRDAHQATGTKQ